MCNEIERVDLPEEDDPIYCYIPIDYKLGRILNNCCQESFVDPAKIAEYSLLRSIKEYITNRNEELANSSISEIQDHYRNMSKDVASLVKEKAKNNAMFLVPDEYLPVTPPPDEECKDCDSPMCVNVGKEPEVTHVCKDDVAKVIRDRDEMLAALADVVKTSHSVTINVDITVDNK
jgi:hypothetical protein